MAQFNPHLSLRTEQTWRGWAEVVLTLDLLCRWIWESLPRQKSEMMAAWLKILGHGAIYPFWMWVQLTHVPISHFFFHVCTHKNPFLEDVVFLKRQCTYDQKMSICDTHTHCIQSGMRNLTRTVSLARPFSSRFVWRENVKKQTRRLELLSGQTRAVHGDQWFTMFSLNVLLVDSHWPSKGQEAHYETVFFPRIICHMFLVEIGSLAICVLFFSAIVELSREVPLDPKFAKIINRAALELLGVTDVARISTSLRFSSERQPVDPQHMTAWLWHQKDCPAAEEPWISDRGKLTFLRQSWVEMCRSPGKKARNDKKEKKQKSWDQHSFRIIFSWLRIQFGAGPFWHIFLEIQI